MLLRKNPSVNLPLPAAVQHIELNRQFRQVLPTIDPEQAALESYAAGTEKAPEIRRRLSSRQSETGNEVLRKTLFWGWGERG